MSQPLVSAGELQPQTSESQLKLLTISLNRVVFSVHAIPLVAMVFLFAMWWHRYDVVPMAIWALLYVAGALVIRRWQARFVADCETRPAHEVNAQWIPRLKRAATIHGLALGSGTWLVAMTKDPILNIFWLVSIAGILAINATHQTGILNSFLRFFALCWVQVALATPWTVPNYSGLTLALTAIYALALYHHAKGIHRFLVQQMDLEQKSLILAMQYQSAKEQALSALAAKNSFLMTASHDLRQPVHALGFLIESISFRSTDPHLRPALTDLRTAVKAVQIMFDSLLDLSRIENETAVRAPERLDMNAIIVETLSLFDGDARARGLRLRAKVSSRAKHAIADPVLIRRALVNLVQNALRYTLEGGVLITARRFDSMLRLQVWDTGIGVASEDQTKIYSPLYRLENAWHISSEGHGLGLSVVARCTELMGTQHGLRSREGKGSMFWFDVHAAQAREDSTQSAPHRDAESAVTALLRGRCLIVDDDPLVSNAWEHLLTSWASKCAALRRERLPSFSSMAAIRPMSSCAISGCARAKAVSRYWRPCSRNVRKPAARWSAANSIRPHSRRPRNPGTRFCTSRSIHTC
ncbi:sensor histidine kinase [Diaphorobacter aerolatus]|uniref:histidine kinase n=1 Tax=Diaphorobacter aerolatus TaxID=1288495 RepID=A0A7H0GMZ9_9BURK|nr:HAMP domain-containing sensor histidine kinase [Diaphorobacter aerolatus]QNP49665.1 HAMP domain-containing histidine kinase [Diaphorobacter aerolatus]